MSTAVDVVNAVSVLETGVSAVALLASLFPGAHHKGARVKIFTSQGYDADRGKKTSNTNTGGRIRSVWGYDAGNTLLGYSGGGAHIGSNGHHEFQIHQGNTRQALYIDVVADDDAVCIPVITVIQPDGAGKYGWVGDVFQGCGLANYYGNVDASGQGHYPRCGWIDANHDNVDQASFKWYLPAFTAPNGEPDITDKSFYCHPRPLEVRYDAEPIEKRSDSELQERQNRIRSAFKINELITSPHLQHPASKLCEDPTTVGPDFVSLHEKTFCDMSAKRWYRLCDDGCRTRNCFDLNIDNKTLSGRFSNPKCYGLGDTLFTYEQVTQWR